MSAQHFRNDADRNNNGDNNYNQEYIDELLRQYATHTGFAPGFASRLRQRLPIASARSRDGVWQELVELFPRFALAGLVVIVLLFWYNAAFMPENPQSSVVEFAFGVSAEIQDSIQDSINE